MRAARAELLAPHRAVPGKARPLVGVRVDGGGGVVAGPAIVSCGGERERRDGWPARARSAHPRRYQSARGSLCRPSASPSAAPCSPRLLAPPAAVCSPRLPARTSQCERAPSRPRACVQLFASSCLRCFARCSRVHLSIANSTSVHLSSPHSLPHHHPSITVHPLSRISPPSTPTHSFRFPSLNRRLVPLPHSAPPLSIPPMLPSPSPSALPPSLSRPPSPPSSVPSLASPSLPEPHPEPHPDAHTVPPLAPSPSPPYVFPPPPGLPRSSMWRPRYSDDASPDVPSPVAHAHPSSAPTLARPPHDPHDPRLLHALSAALATESTMSLSTTASASDSALPDTVTSTSWIPAKQPLPPHHDHNHADVEKAAGARLDTAAQPMGVQEVRVDPVQDGVRARTEEKPAAAGDAPPDGGARAWLTVIGAWLVQFATFGYISAFGVYQDYYATTFLPAQTSSNISWIGSLQLCLMYLPGVFVGRAFDAGYFHHLEITGSIIYIFSIFMLSLARPGEYYQVFLAQAVGMGLGLGLTFIPSLSIVSHHFRARRALAVGVVISGASMGGIAFPIMLNRLIQDAGFANAVRASGAVAGGCLVLANVLMRTRLPPKARHSFGGRGPWAEWRGIVWDGPYLWSICGAFLTSLGVYVPLFYLQLFAADHGVTPRVTTYVLAILNAGSTLGRILPTFLADRLGVYNMLLPAILVCTAMIFAMFGATDVPGAVCVAVVFGFASGAYISLIPTLLVQLCRNMGELGVKMGLAYTIVASANLIGNPIAGALLGTDRGTGGPLEWWRAIVFTGCVAGAGLVCMAVSRMLFARRKGKQRV